MRLHCCYCKVFFPSLSLLSVTCHLFHLILGPTSYTKLFRGFVISLLLFWCLLRASSRLLDLSVPPFRVVLTRFPTKSDLVNSFVDVIVVVAWCVWSLVYANERASLLTDLQPFYKPLGIQQAHRVCFVFSFFVPNYHHRLPCTRKLTNEMKNNNNINLGLPPTLLLIYFGCLSYSEKQTHSASASFFIVFNENKMHYSSLGRGRTGRLSDGESLSLSWV